MFRLIPVAVLLASAVAGCTSGGDEVPLPDASFRVDGAAVADAAVSDGDVTEDRCTDESRDGTLGMACASSAECDDGCFCNGVEQCLAGTCEAAADPCADDIECTDDVCVEEADACQREPVHAMCGDENACNGYEVCDPALGCRPASPLYCNDEDSCTVDSCDSEAGCVHEPRDLDGDGYRDGTCGGDDCDDDPRFGTEIHPGATEVCDNRRDDDCDGLRDYHDGGDCFPMNDTCAGAVMLPGPGTYSGSTAGLSDSYSLECATGGPDAVFRFTLTEAQDVRVSVAGGGSSVAVALRAWGDCATGPDEQCGASSPPSVLRRSLPAGDYAILVETSSGAPFDLTLMTSPPTPIPPVDVCDASTEDISGGGTFGGMFAEVGDDYDLGCHGSVSHPDAAYRLVLTSSKDVRITGSTTGSTWPPSTYLSLTTDCADPSAEIWCRTGRPAEILRRGLPAGVYYVLVESSASDATDWSIDVSITDPALRAVGDACSTAVDITSGTGSVALSGAELDSGTSCGGATSSSRDVFFYFDLAATQDVTLTTNGPGFHYVGLQTACGDTSSEVRCRSATPPMSQTFRSLPAGRYYVVVATTASSGTVTADITTSAPTPVPPNDRCGGAIEIGGGYTSRDTLVGFEDDLVGCSGSGRPDAFYVLTLAARKRVIMSASRVAGSTDQIYLTLRDSCTASTNLACDDGSGTAALTRTLDAGTYYLMVENAAGAEGEYVLDVFVQDPL